MSIRIGDLGDCLVLVVGVQPQPSIAAMNSGHSAARMIIKNDLEKPVVASGPGTSALVVVLEMKRVTAPVGPANHPIVLIPEKAERRVEQVTADGQVSRRIISVADQRASPTL